MISVKLGALQFISVLEQPSLANKIDALNTANFPQFLLWPSAGNCRWHRIYEMFPSYQLVACDESGIIIGSINSVPILWDGLAENLPDGFDEVLMSSTDYAKKTITNTVCLLSISIEKSFRGLQLPAVFIEELKRRAKQTGDFAVIAPLRPTKKHFFPGVTMSEYIQWKDESGDIFDPWLRTHMSLGAVTLAIAERSLTISQPLFRWKQLNGFEIQSDEVGTVPGALSHVIIDSRKAVGIYIEPNVWVSHWL